MLRIAVCLAAFITLSVAHMTFKDCGGGEVKTVDVTGCDGAACTLHKGKEVTITVDFTANEDSKTAKIELIAEYGGLKIPVPGVETDGCKFMKCPLVKGQEETLKYVVTIPAIAPSIEADVTAKMIGDGGKVLGCGSVHGKITN